MFYNIMLLLLMDPLLEIPYHHDIKSVVILIAEIFQFVFSRREKVGKENIESPDDDQVITPQGQFLSTKGSENLSSQILSFQTIQTDFYKNV